MWFALLAAGTFGSALVPLGGLAQADSEPPSDWRIAWAEMADAGLWVAMVASMLLVVGTWAAVVGRMRTCVLLVGLALVHAAALYFMWGASRPALPLGVGVALIGLVSVWFARGACAVQSPLRRP